MRTVKCGACGKPFSSKVGNARYCSDPCRSEGRRRYYRKYMRRCMADPEKRALNAARARAYSAARRARDRGERDGQGPPARRSAGGDEPRAVPPLTSTCRLCGITFEVYGSAAHSYCRQCTAKTDMEIARKRRMECKECGKVFVTSRIAKYCSDACRAAGRRKSERKRMADPEKRAMAGAYTRAWLAAQGKKG